MKKRRGMEGEKALLEKAIDDIILEMEKDAQDIGDMKAEIGRCDLKNIINTAKIKRMAEQHWNKAKVQEAKAKEDIKRNMKDKNSDKKEGLKSISRHIGEHGGKPLTCVERDSDTSDGGKEERSQAIPKM